MQLGGHYTQQLKGATLHRVCEALNISLEANMLYKGRETLDRMTCKKTDIFMAGNVQFSTKRCWGQNI